MGRFIVEQLAREGVDTRGVKVDPERLTALVILGIRDDERVPADLLPRELRRHGADRGRHRRGLHRRGPRRARHRHPSQPPAHRGGGAEGADARPQARRAHGARHRLPPEPLGRRRPRRGREPLRRERRGDAQAAGDAAPLRPHRRHRGGVPHRRRHRPTPRGAPRGPRRLRRHAGLQARRHGRRRPSKAPIPASLDDGQTGPGFPIEVFNVLGAGDGFFSGLLRGWLTGQDWPTSLKFANACGAFAVSRHGCTPAYPSLAELEFFLDRGVVRPDLRNDAAARAGPLGDQPPARAWRRLLGDAGLRLRPPDAARGDGRAPPPRRSAPSSSSACRPRFRCSDGRPGYGILCDNRLGRAALHAASGTGLWIGRPCEWPGSRPLTLEPELGSDYGGLNEWAREDVVKVLCFCHPDDAPEMRERAGGDGQAALGGLAPQPARVPARDHPVQGRRRSTTTPPRR